MQGSLFISEINFATLRCQKWCLLGGGGGEGGLVSSIDDTWPTTVMGSTETSLSIHRDFTRSVIQKANTLRQEGQVKHLLLQSSTKKRLEFQSARSYRDRTKVCVISQTLEYYNNYQILWVPIMGISVSKRTHSTSRTGR